MHKFAFRLLQVPGYVQHFDTSPMNIIMTQMEVINEWVLCSSRLSLLYRSIVVSLYVNLRSNVLCPLVFISHEYLPKVFYLIQCLAINPYGVRTFQDNVRVIYDH